MKVLVFNPSAETIPPCSIPDFPNIDAPEDEGYWIVQSVDKVPPDWADLIILIGDAANPFPNISSQAVPADRLADLLDQTIVDYFEEDVNDKEG